MARTTRPPTGNRSGPKRRPAAPTIPALKAVTTVAAYAFRACLPPRRRLGLLLPALGAVLFGVLAHAVVSDSPERAFATVASAGLFSIVLPIGCLVIGDAVLGAEARAGTLHFTWLSPIPRWTIAVGRWLTGALVAAVVLSLACGLAAVVAGVPENAAAMVVSVAAASAAYVAVFVMLAAATRRAVVWSLAFVVLIERLLGAALDGIAQLSPGWLARAAYGGLTGASELSRKGVPSGGAALWRLVVVTAVALAVASWRLADMRASARSD
jgi:ABC-type transport system involved in multi-copper enzyme maturation permease subunit